MTSDTSNGDYPKSQRAILDEQLASFRETDTAREHLIQVQAAGP